MKFKWIVSLAAIALIPNSLIANTIHFPHVPYGGGYSTTFVIMNTGATPVASQVNFYSQAGASLPAFTMPVNLAAGASTRFTIPDSGPLNVMWAELAAGAGTVRGVATFDLRGGGALMTTVGVLGVEAGNTFLLPVEVTMDRRTNTGVAVSNVGTVTTGLRLRLLAENGSEVAVATDPRFASLGPRSQAVDYITGIFPQLTGTAFKGSLVVEAGTGAPANTLSATALTEQDGIFSALPVLPGGPTGGTTGETLYFPHVPFGSGYSTSFVVLNTGTTPFTSQVRFFAQGGATVPAYTTQISVPAGGSTRFTVPNTGALTVMWGELLAGSGSVKGVSTFDLRDGNNRLQTTVGVLGAVGGNSFLLPIEVTADGKTNTGVAIANVTDGTVPVRVSLIGENGVEIAVASAPAFTSIGARSQFANYATAIFPQLSGTNFKGTLAVTAGTGAPAKSLTATALTEKEGIFSAIPVLQGGSTGGGSGVGLASECLVPSVFNSPATLHLEYSFSGVIDGTSVTDAVQTPNASFEGNTANEWRTTQVNTTGFASTTTRVTTYNRLEGLEIVQFGSISELANQGTTRSVFTPPFRDKRYTLAPGESLTATSTQITTTTIPGSAPTSATTTSNTTVRYLGQESVTVPAGTFRACKFETVGQQTLWEAVGKGVQLKSTSIAFSGATITVVLKSGTINGSPIVP